MVRSVRASPAMYQSSDPEKALPTKYRRRKREAPLLFLQKPTENEMSLSGYLVI